MINAIKNSFLGVMLLMSMVSCMPRAYSTISDEQQCVKPPPDVFAGVGVELQVAELGFGRISLKGGLVKSDPKAISTITQAAQDERVWKYLLCKEDLRKGFSKDQYAWFHRLRQFSLSKPNPEEYMKWETQNPFPLATVPPATATVSHIADYSKWQVVTYSSSDTITIIDANPDKVVKIESKKGRSEVWIVSPKLTGPGVYTLEGKVKGENLVPQGGESYHRGKFQGVIFDGNREVAWPNNDFDRTDGWIRRSVKVNLNADETAVFRVGLQQTQGIVYVKDIRIAKIR